MAEAGSSKAPGAVAGGTTRAAAVRAAEAPMVTIGRRPAERAHAVAVVAFPGMNPFELGCVIEVFGLPRPELELGLGPDRAWYDFKVCAETRAPMAVVGGLRIGAEFGLADFAAADTLIVTAVPDVRGGNRAGEGADSAEVEEEAGTGIGTGTGRRRGKGKGGERGKERGKTEAAEERAGSVSPALLNALREGHARGARIVSICSGAFALAEAGLLDGLEATTHWQYADLLARRFPAVRVNPDVLYVDSGQILTSAGSAAGLDLCLHLIRLDYGAAIANSVARRLVLPPHRDGGQAQFIEGGVRPVDASGGGVARSMAWALEHLAERIAVVDLARVAVMSERTYIRQFARATGTAPLRWLVAQRVAAARALLETADASVEEIGAAVGFSDPAGFRRHFVRAVGASPSAYRRTFHPKV